jgi:hypothetical protein
MDTPMIAAWGQHHLGAVLGALMCAALPVEISGQEPAVQGFVADAATSELIPLATVTLVAAGDETQSGPDGRFAFAQASTGPISVRIEAPGYQSVLWETEVVEGRPLFLEVLLSRLEGDGTLSLLVTDEESGAPVAGAEVLLPELGVSAETSETGEALLAGIPSGSWLVVVSAFGYGTASSFIAFDGTSEVEGEVALGEGPIALEGIVVTAEALEQRLIRGGFYERRTVGIGRFLDRAEIEERHPFRPSDLFRSGIPGVYVVERVKGEYDIASRRGSVGFGLSTGPGVMQGGQSNPGPCIMDLYFDGVLYERGMIDDLNTDYIEAIEVYNGISQIPVQYNRTGSNCGVVLVWTRR